MCHLLKSGVAALFGPESGTTSSHVQSICDIYSVCHLLKSCVAALFGPESGTMSSHVQSICDIYSVCHLLKSGVAALFGPDPRPAMFSPSVISIQCATC